MHVACKNGEPETVQMILENWKEFGIDIKALDNQGHTALDVINEELNDDSSSSYSYSYSSEEENYFDEHNEIKKMLEKEYSQIDNAQV